jgi:hypothetical protein
LNLLVRVLLLRSNLSLLFWRAGKEHVRLPTRRPDAIARTAAHCPFGVMVFVTLIAARVAADIALNGRGARGKGGHVDTCSDSLG